ncbi:MAG: hypothetical protein JJV98_10155 [Desulfosarcina sp.]|nr:hypothetical protein [Desulfobacterales bacterium]
MKRKWVLCGILLLAVLGLSAFLIQGVLQKAPAAVVFTEKPADGFSSVAHQAKFPAVPTPTPRVPAEPVSESMRPDESPPREEIIAADVKENAQADLEHARTEVFKAEAMATLPLLTLHTADPFQPDRPGPRRGEIWIRIQPNRSGETRDIMAQVADLYKSTLQYEESVKVMLWVGGQPIARTDF